MAYFWHSYITAKEINFSKALSVFLPVSSMRDVVKSLTGGNLFSKLHRPLIAPGMDGHYNLLFEILKF